MEESLTPPPWPLPHLIHPTNPIEYLPLPSTVVTIVKEENGEYISRNVREKFLQQRVVARNGAMRCGDYLGSG